MRPYFNSLAGQGAKFTKSFGVTHPSQPNYIALFSGSTQGVTSDSCPQNYTGKNNLGAQLIAAGLTFKGYSETMPVQRLHRLHHREPTLASTTAGSTSTTSRPRRT